MKGRACMRSGSAATRSKPPAMTGEELEAELAAAAGDLKKLVAKWCRRPPCEHALIEGVNVSEQLAAVRVAFEDYLTVTSAIRDAHAGGHATGFEAGLAEGRRRAAEQQLPRPRKGSHGKQGPLLRALEGGLAAIGAGGAVRVLHGAGHHAAAVKLAALAVAVPTAAVTAVVMMPSSQTLPDVQTYAGTTPVTHGAVIWSASPVPSSRLIATVTQAAPKGKHRATVTAPTPLLPPTSASAAVTVAPASSPAAQPLPSSSPSMLHPSAGSTGSPRHQRQPAPGSGQYSTAPAGGWGSGNPSPGGSGNGRGGRHSWTPSPPPSPAASDTTVPATSSPAPDPSVS